MNNPNYKTQIQKLDALNDSLDTKIRETRILMNRVMQAYVQLIQAMMTNPAFDQSEREPKNSKISRSKNGKRK
jgi:hypothetical protein